MLNEMVTPTYSEKFTVIFISFLLDVREFVYSPNVVVSDSCSTGQFMKSVVWNATHPDDFSLFWAKSTWKS